MTVAEELAQMTPKEFNGLPEVKRQELIAYNDEYVRQWRATCQKCRKALNGTLHEIREHRCDDSTE